MIRNYLKTAFRSLYKFKAFSALNIFGLSIGIVCAGLILLWVEDEVNFDAFNVKKERLYLAWENQQYDGWVFTESSTPGVMAPAMMQELPGIANTCRMSEDATTLLFGKGDRAVYASGKYVESSIFSMFTLPFVEGNAASAFKQLHSVVITQKTARKFFGRDHNVVGRTILVDNKQGYVVSGVLKDIPSNSTLQFEWLMPFKIFFDQSPWLKSWGNQSLSTYVELKPGVDVQTVNKQLYNFIQKREPRALGHVFLFPMTHWHLYLDFKNGKETGGGQIQYVHLFSIIAGIILIIACINFMNLATARSEKRAREVGVRKVMGAGKGSLIFQFIGEAMMLSIIATIAGIVLIAILLPSFNMLVQKQLSLHLFNPVHLLFLVLITLVCGLLAGSYPALYLSSFQPVSVLKGLKLKEGGAAYIRKGLVVLQFSASTTLIVSTIVVYQQISHVKSRQLGFNRNNLIEVGVQGDLAKNFDPIKQDMLSAGEIENVALTDHAIIYGGNNTSDFAWTGKQPGSKVLISVRYVTPEFFQTSGLKILEGRNLTIADTTAPQNVIVTRSMEKLMGHGSALGKTIYGESNHKDFANIVGVVNDYVYGSMYTKSSPVVFVSLQPQQSVLMYVRIKRGVETQRALNTMQGILKKYNPAYPFDYHFVDDQFNNMFNSEMLVSKLSRLFAILAIIISCLGLFGLAAYTAERRTKEIGIRKVLGASVRSLTTLLSKDFLKLVIVSCVIAFPIAWYTLNKWLQNYEYRIHIQWWVFAAAGATAILIAVVTISFQSIKTALIKPVISLRNE